MSANGYLNDRKEFAMSGYRKNTGLVVGAVVLAFLVFPFHSEAQSANVSLSALECERVSQLVLEKMDVKQRAFSRQCDMVEASHDWERQYGGLNERELVAGVVYE